MYVRGFMVYLCLENFIYYSKGTYSSCGNIIFCSIETDQRKTNFVLGLIPAYMCNTAEYNNMPSNYIQLYAILLYIHNYALNNVINFGKRWCAGLTIYLRSNGSTTAPR